MAYTEVVRRIPLRGAKEALVSEEDYERVAALKWHLHSGKYTDYAKSMTRDRKTLSMHRFILDAPKGKHVDHIDGSGLNNTRRNLRICHEGWENSANRRKVARKTSQYKGVSFHSLAKCWVVYIGEHNKITNLGSYDSEEMAARVYDAAASVAFGEYACLNFPDEAPMSLAEARSHRRNNKRGPKPKEKPPKPPSTRKFVSRYRGVTRQSDRWRWKVLIHGNGEYHYRGGFKTEIEAALAYDEMARQHHGAKAKLNFPNGLEAVNGGD